MWAQRYPDVSQRVSERVCQKSDKKTKDFNKVNDSDCVLFGATGEGRQEGGPATWGEHSQTYMRRGSNCRSDEHEPALQLSPSKASISPDDGEQPVRVVVIWLSVDSRRIAIHMYGDWRGVSRMDGMK